MTAPPFGPNEKPISERTAQIDECLELAGKAREIGDDVTFLAAIHLAAQLVQLAKIEAKMREAGG